MVNSAILSAGRKKEERKGGCPAPGGGDTAHRDVRRPKEKSNKNPNKPPDGSNQREKKWHIFGKKKEKKN